MGLPTLSARRAEDEAAGGERRASCVAAWGMRRSAAHSSMGDVWEGRVNCERAGAGTGLGFVFMGLGELLDLLNLFMASVKKIFEARLRLKPGAQIRSCTQPIQHGSESQI